MCDDVKHLNNTITVTARYSTAEISNRFQILLDTDLPHRGMVLTMALLLVAIGSACSEVTFGAWNFNYTQDCYLYVVRT